MSGNRFNGNTDLVGRKPRRMTAVASLRMSARRSTVAPGHGTHGSNKKVFGFRDREPTV